MASIASFNGVQVTLDSVHMPLPNEEEQKQLLEMREQLKEDLENQYNNLKCILAKSNLGMGSGNNIGIKAADTDYVLLLNPDVLLEDNTIEELFLASQKLNNFSMLAPLEKNFNNLLINLVKNEYVLKKPTFIRVENIPSH